MDEPQCREVRSWRVVALANKMVPCQTYTTLLLAYDLLVTSGLAKSTRIFTTTERSDSGSHFVVSGHAAGGPEVCIAMLIVCAVDISCTSLWYNSPNMINGLTV